MISEAATSKTGIELILPSAKLLLGIINKLDGMYAKCTHKKKIIEGLGTIVSAGNTEHCMLLV